MLNPILVFHTSFDMVNSTQQSGTMGGRRGRGGSGRAGRGGWGGNDTGGLPSAAAPPPTAPTTIAPNNKKQCLKKWYYGILLDWLEQPESFQLLHGGGSGRTKIGGHVQLLKTVFAQMLIVLHATGFSRCVTNGDNLSKRYVRYKKRF